MFIERQLPGGRAFIEFERRGDRFDLKRHGFVRRARTDGRQPCQRPQATEGPLIHDGSQTTLSTTQNAQNSSITGTTLAGPSGSGQFLVVTLSTTNVARTVTIASTLAGANSVNAYGVLQNKPGPGLAADVGIFGVSKVVGGTTTILAGSPLAMSSTVSGLVSLWSAGLGTRVGQALEPVTAVGQVISAAIYAFGVGPPST